jgi:hypothetical protein
MKNVQKNPKRNTLYTSGSIEFNKDPNTWREHMRNELKHKFHVIIPWAASPPAAKGTPEYNEWIHRNFVMPDMSDVARSRFFFIRIDEGVLKGAGTISELSLAAWFNRYIVAFLDGVKIGELPGWMCGCLNTARFVNSIEEAIEHFKKLEIETESEEE